MSKITIIVKPRKLLNDNYSLYLDIWNIRGVASNVFKPPYLFFATFHISDFCVERHFIKFNSYVFHVQKNSDSLISAVTLFLLCFCVMFSIKRCSQPLYYDDINI